MTETATIRLTMAQALIRFSQEPVLSNATAWKPPSSPAASAFLATASSAGVGQALLENPDFPYYQVRNEQATVHAATAYAKVKNRLQTFACTSSIGPGATNMITGAATATINRLPVLLLARRHLCPPQRRPGAAAARVGPSQDISVNDCFKPVSRYWDRINRPDQLLTALPEAMRVLTSPAETGAVTLALPQDVQAEAYDYPDAFFHKRVWHIPRNRADRAALQQAAELIRASRRPLIVAGGGVIYSGATEALRSLSSHRHPRGRDDGRQGQPALGPPAEPGRHRRHRHAGRQPRSPTTPTWSSASAPATAISRPPPRPPSRTRTCASSTSTWPSSTPASTTACRWWATPASRWKNWASCLAGYRVDARLPCRGAAPARRVGAEVERIYAIRNAPLPSQGELIGALNEVSGPDAIMVNAAGSMPGDLHKLWRTTHPKNFHMEYGYSCMGYEIAGGLGVKMAAPERDVYVIVGDGSYLMLSSELVTSRPGRLQADRRAVGQPRIQEHRLAQPLAGPGRLRHALHPPQRRRAGGRFGRRRGRAAADRLCDERPQPRLPRHRMPDLRRLRRRAADRQDDRSHDRYHHLERPAGGRAGLRELVGRGGGGGQRAFDGV